MAEIEVPESLIAEAVRDAQSGAREINPKGSYTGYDIAALASMFICFYVLGTRAPGGRIPKEDGTKITKMVGSYCAKIGILKDRGPGSTPFTDLWESSDE